MGVRTLGRIALLIQDSAEAQALNNTISSRQIYGDPEDMQALMGQSRVGMLKEKHNRLVKQINFSFYTKIELFKPARFIE